MSPVEEAQAAYEATMERRRVVNEEWESLGKPVMTTGSRGQPVVHPLIGTSPSST